MTIPHHFPSLIDGPCQVIIIAGTGLSFPIAPSTDNLLPTLKTTAADLGLPSNDDFYKLADTVFQNRVANGMSESESRLWLARLYYSTAMECVNGRLKPAISTPGNVTRI
ncbi:MAG: hypothetical protein KKE37_09090 [Verrucomicrobia bacterium]|nr:hypothetical protein [Verrucomicrobiota bacterium]MBU4291586.1 hypothetical protein [Verrucomicrobiota bacterium]MBU4429490.1 hypothetical protein [Verrucomicrobiota bacterium]MCG2679817.1 hypothetical protein [Kiritimatiellia bacterium]